MALADGASLPGLPARGKAELGRSFIGRAFGHFTLVLRVSLLSYRRRPGVLDDVSGIIFRKQARSPSPSDAGGRVSDTPFSPRARLVDQRADRIRSQGKLVLDVLLYCDLSAWAFASVVINLIWRISLFDERVTA
ncbi:MAG: hypothetical protein ACLSHC_11410 [Bilophila wadsworthia]